MTGKDPIDVSLEQKKAQEVIQNMKNRILVCSGTGCIANGAQDVLNKFNELGAKAEFQNCFHTI
ncbi:MAG: (2Fe-2S) ferredoxin domain-containing protein, partial [bacterium]